MNFNGGHWHQTLALAIGQSKVVTLVHGGPFSASVSCAATGTATAELTLDDPNADSPVWLPLGTVGAGLKAEFFRSTPVRGLRFTAAIAAATVTVVQGKDV